ncbi:WSC domain protein [Aspergillus sclerotialis]|uniref:WSC domain protein n=1 Tax=Aspergillus sclerotialis TaxID=2070753 RepID=A0A3A2ZMJ0_9EURO|nr:WSC domain protein [Aspergillus sclerotialis]
MFFKSLTSLTLASLLALSTAKEHACFNHPGPLQRTGDYKQTSIEVCTAICKEADYIIAGATGGNQCWCGNAIPEQSNQIPATSCDVPCNGAKDEKCGGDGFWSIWAIPASPASSTYISSLQSVVPVTNTPSAVAYNA